MTPAYEDGPRISTSRTKNPDASFAPSAVKFRRSRIRCPMNGPRSYVIDRQDAAPGSATFPSVVARSDHVLYAGAVVTWSRRVSLGSATEPRYRNETLALAADCRSSHGTPASVLVRAVLVVPLSYRPANGSEVHVVSLPCHRAQPPSVIRTECQPPSWSTGHGSPKR